MTDPGVKPRRWKFWKYLQAAAVIGALLLAAFAWYSTTDSFQARVRRRLVRELERVTGGRVDLGSVHTTPFRFRVDVRDLTIHGREGSGEVPYAHVDRLVATVKIISVLGAEFGFHSIVLDHPVVHVIVYKDGTTNQPTPQIAAVSGNNRFEQFLGLSISRLDIRHGEVLWNDQKIPFDFVANDVLVSMQYSVLHRRYTTDLLVGKIDTKFADYRPLSWMTEAHFAIGSDGLEIKSFKATSGRSLLQFSGKLQDFRQPRLEGEYTVTIDLAEASAVTRRPEPRQGLLQMTGRGSWSTGTFSSKGNLLVKGADLRTETLRLHADNMSSTYTVSPQQLAFSDIKATLLGGEVSGSAEVNNWLLTPTPRTAKEKAGSEQRGIVRLKLKDLSIEGMATALASAARPLERSNFAGLATGTIETRWRGSIRNGESEIAVDVVTPDRILQGQIPVTAHAHAVYRHASEELEVSEFNAGTRATQVHATGTLSRRAALRLSVSTNDLGEWEPVLNALGYQENSPVVLRGRASFTGTASGKLSEIDFAGKVQSQELSLVLPPTARIPREEIRWDNLAADVQLSPFYFTAHNGMLRRGDTTISFDLNLGLDQRKFANASTFTANVQMHAADVAEMLAIAGYDFPATGKMDLFLYTAGTRAQPRGQGTIHLSDAVIRGQAVQQADSKFSFSSGELSLSEIRLARDEGRITGDGTYEFGNRAFRLNLHGDGFDLARFPPILGRIPIEGRLEFDAHSSGTLEEPVINATVICHDLSFDHEKAGDFTFDAITHGADLQLSGRSRFKNAELNIDGSVHLRDNWPSTVSLHFNHLDVDSLLGIYLKGHLTGDSAAAGDLQLIGPLHDPQALQVTGSISDFFAEVEHIQVRNNGPVHFTIQEGTLEIQQLRLMGQGTDLTLAGKIQIGREHQMDLRADGHADLALIESFNPDFTSSGVVTVGVGLAGTVERPAIQGRLQISGGSIRYSDLPSALSDLNGSLVFNQDRLQIESLTAHVGGGLITFGGFATAYNRQLNFDLTLQGQDVRLRYPPGVSSMTNADVRWSGTVAGSTLSGNATITKLAVTPGFDFGSYLQRSAQASALPQMNPLLNRIRIDVHIVTTPELQMQTAAVRLSGDADLHLRGTAAKPVLLGRADIIEGAVYFSGAKYSMERGDVTFSNPVTTTPVLDLQASTKVRDYEITLNLNGAIDKLSLSYHSEPPLPTADIINLLALGQTQEQSAQIQQSGQAPAAQQASSALLAEALNSAVSSRSQKLFGISHIKIDPQGLNTETTPSQTTQLPAVTIEQQVRDDLTLTYTTNVGQTSQQIIQGAYNITHDVSIVGIRDYNGVVSFEIRFRQRRK